MRRLLISLALSLSLALPVHQAAAAGEIEDYARYDGQTRCTPWVKPGTRVFAAWLVHRHGGGTGALGRTCTVGGVSEHKEGRAFDWVLDATKTADRARARRFLEQLFATDAAGNTHALARRMGVMYVIWNDRMYAAYDGFRPRAYLSSGCPNLRRCSATLRHRDHLHVSLSRRGGWGRTSWYAGRVALR